ncbi:MAG: hypothetical protein K8R36_25565 [Planctomycetales bacterium]|nr:hypothetical protein [Planctomycetales bacterium]
MSAAKNLSNTLQAIIDNRLDAIDQNLLRAGLPRHQRRSIVEEVENQILEMLSRLEVTEYTRADVLAVLAKLDPPEAYVPEDAPGRPAFDAGATVEKVSAAARAGVQASVTAAGQVVERVKAEWSPAWLACFAAGLGVISLLLALVFVEIVGPGEGAVIGALFLMLMAGASTLLGALSLFYLRRSKDQKLALAAALFATLLYPMLILNGLVLAIGVFTFPVSVALLALLAFIAINGALGRLCWRWATRKPAEKPAEKPAAIAAPLIITG